MPSRITCREGTSVARKPLIVLGVDGMDPVVLHRLRSRLPCLDQMLGTTGSVQYESIFPPDSVPAWISFFTGMNPAEHGILHSIDYLSPQQADQVDVGRFRGRTFWDFAGTAGKRVAVVNPFLAYPPWPVAGAMASGPSFIEGNPQVVPTGAGGNIPLPHMGGYKGLPREDELGAFLDEAERDTRDLTNYALRLLRDVQPDLLFITYLTLDRIKHFIWRFVDPDDPTYPGPNPHADALERFYRLFDETIGIFRQEVGADTRMLVMSDHGHGRRCTELINFNELLRREELLVCRGGNNPFSKAKLMERGKNAAITYAHAWRLEGLLQRISRRIPNRKALKRGEHVIDRERSIAHTPDFDGANPYGGIRVNQAALTDQDYEETRERIIRLLLNLSTQYPEVPNGVVRRAFRREELYTGPYLDHYPDVLFELEPAFGVNWSVFAPVVVANPRHRTLSGGHLMQGVLLVSVPSMAAGLHKQETPMTLFNHVLAWLDVQPAAWASSSTGQD